MKSRQQPLLQNKKIHITKSVKPEPKQMKGIFHNFAIMIKSCFEIANIFLKILNPCGKILVNFKKFFGPKVFFSLQQLDPF